MKKKDGNHSLEFPEALAKIHISNMSKSIQNVSLDDNVENDTLKEATSSSRKRKTSRKKTSTEKDVDKIWKAMNAGQIDISYACVGYALDGRAVLDNSAFIDLLINYGFKIVPVMQFIDEFASIAKDDDAGPIVMINQNLSKIMTDIKEL